MRPRALRSERRPPDRENAGVSCLMRAQRPEYRKARISAAEPRESEQTGQRRPGRPTGMPQMLDAVPRQANRPERETPLPPASVAKTYKNGSSCRETGVQGGDWCRWGLPGPGGRGATTVGRAFPECRGGDPRSHVCTSQVASFTCVSQWLPDKPEPRPRPTPHGAQCHREGRGMCPGPCRACFCSGPVGVRQDWGGLVGAMAGIGEKAAGDRT